jgi:hypothetical protein
MKTSRTIAISGVLFAAIAFPTIAIGGPGNYPAPSPPSGGTISPAPGPIAGAGLPFVAVGYGAYWLVRRYRRKSDKPAA